LGCAIRDLGSDSLQRELVVRGWFFFSTIVTAKGEVFSYGGLLGIKGFNLEINWKSTPLCDWDRNARKIGYSLLSFPDRGDTNKVA